MGKSDQIIQGVGRLSQHMAWGTGNLGVCKGRLNILNGDGICRLRAPLAGARICGHRNTMNVVYLFFILLIQKIIKLKIVDIYKDKGKSEKKRPVKKP